MPASLISNNAPRHFQPAATWLSGSTSAELRSHSARHISIGLINNMPDGALESTERQFLSLLDAASGDLHVRLSLYSLPEISRKGAAASHVRTFYSDIDALWKSNLDGLIVTGREPMTQRLDDEPYWGTFTRVLDWARENTYSTVWSCLAAHAAVLYCDGVTRVKSKSKHCGIFECSRVGEHPLTAGLGMRFQLPHSRWNGVPESALRRSGYRVLSRSADVGVDMFVKQYKSLFVFLQGHPEYGADTLLLEYRRDVGRYLRGESEKYPAIPESYFSSETIAALQGFQEEALRYPRRELFTDVCTALAEAKIEATWRSGAESLYGGWLEHISAQKETRMRIGAVEMRAGGEPAAMPIPFENAARPNLFREDRVDGRLRPRRVAAGG